MDVPSVTNKPKKRKINGKARDDLKKRRLSSHEIGENCYCQRFKCFEVTTEAERQELIARFNDLGSKDEQDAFLSTLVTVKPIERRRQREDCANHIPNDNSYSYFVPIQRGERSSQVPVCFRGFLSCFGITKRRMETIKNSLKNTGLLVVFILCVICRSKYQSRSSRPWL